MYLALNMQYRLSTCGSEPITTKFCPCRDSRPRFLRHRLTSTVLSTARFLVIRAVNLHERMTTSVKDYK